MGTIAEKTIYLNTTKAQIKDGINRLGGELTNLDTFREYKEALDNIYDKLPKVTGTGSDLSLTPTLKGGMNTIPIGNTEQEGTPTPDNPIDVKVVTGDNQVVVCNKNLFNGVWELGYIDGTTGQNASNNNLIRCKDYIEVTELTTYKFSVDNPNIVNMLIYEYKTDFTYNLTTNKAINIANDYLTTNANTKYIRFRPGYQTTDTSLKCQVEKGTVATDYVVHQEQSTTLHLGSLELCKIGDYQDVITGSKDNWKVVRKVGKVVLNGSESWELFWATNGIFLNRNTNIISDVNGINGISNNFTVTTRTNIRNNLTTVDNLMAFNQNELVIAYKTISSIDNFKIWLQTHNIIGYYILRSEARTETPITDTSLINELNGLQDLLSYDGTTNITITSDSNNAQMIVQVSALKGI